MKKHTTRRSPPSRRSGLPWAIAVLVPVLASAQQTGMTGHPSAAARHAAVSVAPLSPAERGQLTRSFVLKWGHYVERVYGVPVGTWAKRMVPGFATADAANFRKAMQRDTFEGAMAELTGTGQRLSDERVIDRMARTTAKSARAPLTLAASKALGSLASDLMYTPVVPCRVVDTRHTVAGVIPVQTTRDFMAVNQPNYTAQGGSATDCGVLGANASAVVLHVTVVSPAANGFATIYPFGAARPLASNLNYNAGQTINSTVVVKIPNPTASSDFTLFSEATAHYVADIVGYYAPPVATALECTNTFVSSTVLANATFDIAIPACPTGYTLTGAGCRTLGFNQAAWGINGMYATDASSIGTFCSGTNTTAGSITVQGTARCCRVPGR